MRILPRFHLHPPPLSLQIEKTQPLTLTLTLIPENQVLGEKCQFLCLKSTDLAEESVAATMQLPRG